MANIPGTDGDDTLYGTSDPDTVTGLGGNDTLIGFAGADSLDGGSGTDTAFYFDSSAGVAVNLATGKGTGGSAQGDTLVSIENLWGSDYNDTLTGNDGANDLHGLDGSDILKGGGGADSLDGGSGDDILKGGGGADSFEGGTGNDTVSYSDSPSSGGTGIYGVSVDLYPGDFPGHGVGADAQDDTYSSIENVTGSGYIDYLTGTDDANVLNGLDGDDTLVGNGGNDTLDGGNGADRLTGGLGDDLLRGGPGADELNGAGGPVTIEGSDTADYSDKTDGVAVTLDSNIVVDVFVGGVLEDTMRNMENVIGGSGNDTFVGDYRANVLTGGAGNDSLNGGTGIDTMIGGAGNDLMYVDNVGDVVTEVLNEGIDTVRSTINFTLGDNVERLALLGSTSVNGTGNDLANIITGNSAANILIGRGGGDTLNGAAGADEMRGGLGNDHYVVDNVGDTIVEGYGNGTDSVKSSVNFSLSTSVENLRLVGAGAISGTGNGLDNHLTGNGAANALNGAAGIDTIDGAAGNDTLNGGIGNDVLTGGAGADKYMFDSGLNGSTNVDQVAGFSAVDDTIVLDQTIFSALPSLGTLAAGRFFAGAAAHDADDRIIYDSATGKIFYDADGNGAGAQVLFAQLGAGTALTNADFLIVA
jgi:Ca2+-binding RTX toxin-like protein